MKDRWMFWVVVRSIIAVTLVTDFGFSGRSLAGSNGTPLSANDEAIFPHRTRAAAGAESGAGDCGGAVVNVFEGVDFKLVRRVDWAGNHVFFTGFSPDGKLYLGGGDTNTLRVWEVATGTQLVELPVTAGVVTPDGKQLIGHKSDKTFVVFDLNNGQSVRSWDADEAIGSVALSPDGTQVVSGHTDGVIRLWDLKSMKEIKKFSGHEGFVEAAFSGDGKQILSAGMDRMIRLWNVESGKLVRVFENFKDATGMEGHDLIVKAYFLPGGRQVAGYVWGTDKTLLVLNVENGAMVRSLPLGEDHHKDVAISPDGRWFLSVHGDRTVRVRDMMTGHQLARLEVADTNVARAPNFSPDGRSIVSGSWRSWVYLWELEK